MTIRSEYYSVSINISPFKFGRAKEVGCYSTRDTAERVEKFIRLAFEQQVVGGIDIGIQVYTGEMMATPSGLRLKETPNGAITPIYETFSQAETDRILKVLPVILKPQIFQANISSPAVDTPKFLCNGHYYCVVLDFEPFDKTRSFYAGYYLSKITAEFVSKFIMQTHCSRKIGCGFNMRIETYEGTYIEYASGRSYIKIDGKDHELLSSCDNNEIIRLSTSVNKMICRLSQSDGIDRKEYHR